MDCCYIYCGALKWVDERCAGSSKRSPIFSTCCAKEKVLLLPIQAPPPVLYNYLTGTDTLSCEFRQNIRAYNSALAFTSIGAKIDKNVIGTQGPYIYCIHGEMYHRIGSLLSQPITNAPLFAQMYVFDTANKAQNKYNFMSSLDSSILFELQTILYNTNLYVQQNPAQPLTMILKDFRATDPRRYNLPTASENPGILIRDDFLLITSSSNDQKTNEKYNETNQKCVTMMQYYSYQLQIGRSNEEQSRLNYLRFNQKRIWIELYNGLHDVMALQDNASQPLSATNIEIGRLQEVDLQQLTRMEQTSGERYYLRLLLTTNECLKEAKEIQSGAQLCRLFATILLFCHPAQPKQLWKNYILVFCDDILFQANQESGDRSAFTVYDINIYNSALHHLDSILCTHEKSLKDFPNMLIPTFQSENPFLILEPNLINIPDNIILLSQNIHSLINFVYPDLTTSLNNSNYLMNRGILTPKNIDVDLVNDLIMNLCPTESTEYLNANSIDKTSDGYNTTYENLYPIEFLNSLKLSDIPSHKLSLKVGTLIILLHNIDPMNSLCNRTRLICHAFTPRIINTEVIMGKHAGHRVFFP
ncbi:4455_t:CDS:2 [Cetraspora pellucida]|uniref:4455_t:CDS:1 n=1 Tax=Cetraspora pellucida TaxID=1433469 RepID=A0A9N8VVF1_9GLOM|nr:4455_t:CDS:2 [Cetraspora pellucida]